MEKLLDTVCVDLTPKNNGVEALLLTASIFDNGDNTKDSIFTRYEIALCSNGSTATITVQDLSLDELQKFIYKVHSSKSALVENRD
jgi:hypothetical protein